jgi:hypothetical protein
LTGAVDVHFAIYKDETDAAAIWEETQTLQLDEHGRYTVLLGATQPDGLPLVLFESTEARWLGVAAGNLPEQPRVVLVSVPYALKASDAETLGGKPASAYVTTETLTNSSAQTQASGQGQTAIVGLPAEATSNPSTAVGGTGIMNFLPIWTNSTTLGNSTLFETGGKLGIGNTNPAGTLDVSGGAFIRGALELPAAGAATQTFGSNSNPLDLQASAFNSATLAAVPQLFRWQAEPVGNNTTSPSGRLSLLSGSGGMSPLAGELPSVTSGTLVETGLSIASNGQLTFASGQTFPGAGGGTITGVTAGTDLTGGGSAGTVTLNLDTTKVPTLAAASNTFTGTVAASSFSGNGAGLTNLTPANLSAGTAGINISGNAATATTAATASSAATASNALSLGGEAAANYARLDIANSFTGNQSVTGNVSATGSVSGVAASFTGALTAAGAVLPTTGTATASQGYSSGPMDLQASGYNSGTSAAVPQLFRWQAEPKGNDTASPSGTLNLLYLSGSGTPAETGLSIGSNGLLSFASGQTFPGTGTGTVTSVGSGSGLTGGPITSSGTLSIATGGVSNSMLANPSLTVTAGTDLTGGGSVALGSSVALNLDTTKVPTLAAASNTFTGSLAASSFSGNGAGLTNLTPANLSAGTAGISISGNAATATTAATASSATTASNALSLGGVAAANYARLDIANSFTGNQSVTGNVSATGSVSGGTASFSGALTAAGAVLPATGAATASQGYNSNPMDLQASGYNSGTSAAVPQLFRWQAEPKGNDTASPSGTLNLLYLSGSGTPAETGLSIASNGLLTFASGQTFPGGGGTITGVTAGTDLTGGGTTGTVTLNLDTSKVPTLGASSNTFTGSLTASSFTGNGSGLTNLTAANLSAGTAGINISGNAATATAATTAATATNALSLGGVAAGNYARLDIANSFTGNQSVTGNVSATGSVSGATASFSGALTAAGAVLPATATATATQGYSSNPMDLQASSYNSGTSAAVPQLFRWQAEAAGNDTASPSGTLNLLYLSGSGTPAETGLSIASNGLLTFASGQTFPGTGTGTVTSVGSGSGLTGGPITSSGTLSIASGGVTNAMLANPSLTVTAGTDLTGGGSVALGNSVTLNLDTTKVPTLGASSNTFTGSLTASGITGSSGTFSGNNSTQIVSVAQSGSGTALTATGGTTGVYGLTSSSTYGSTGVVGMESATTGQVYGVYGSSISTTALAAGVNGYEDATTGQVYGVAGSTTSTTNSAAGVFGNEEATTGQVYGVAGSTNSTTTSAAGVYGFEAATTGQVYGVLGGTSSTTDGAAGVYGINSANSSYGELGTSFSHMATGVYGNSSAASGNGVWGVATGTGGWGVYGTSSAADGVGVWGQNLTYSSVGLLGGTIAVGSNTLATGVSGLSSDMGVSGTATGTHGYGVYGTGDVGVYATGTSTSGIGVYGQGYSQSTMSDSNATGVWGDTSVNSGYGVLGTESGTTADGVRGLASDSSSIGVFGWNSSTTSGTGVYGLGNTYGVFAAGNLGASGTKSAVVALPDNRVVELYAMESPENWFEDFGSGELREGVAQVTLDPTFALAANAEPGYHVFLTPKGDCEGLYVTNETPAGFQVRELRGGKSNIAFDYRIVAKRRGYESVRMDQLEADPETAQAIREVALRRPAHRRLTLPKLAEAPRVPPALPKAEARPGVPGVAIPKPLEPPKFMAPPEPPKLPALPKLPAVPRLPKVGVPPAAPVVVTPKPVEPPRLPASAEPPKVGAAPTTRAALTPKPTEAPKLPAPPEPAQK